MSMSAKAVDAAIAMNDKLFAMQARIDKLVEALEKISSPRGVLEASEMWDIADQALQEDKRAQRPARPTSAGLCAECGSPKWCHAVIGHEFVELIPADAS